MEGHEAPPLMTRRALRLAGLSAAAFVLAGAVFALPHGPLAVLLVVSLD